MSFYFGIPQPVPPWFYFRKNYLHYILIYLCHCLRIIVPIFSGRLAEQCDSNSLIALPLPSSPPLHPKLLLLNPPITILLIPFLPFLQLSWYYHQCCNQKKKYCQTNQPEYPPHTASLKFALKNLTKVWISICDFFRVEIKKLKFDPFRLFLPWHKGRCLWFQIHQSSRKHFVNWRKFCILNVCRNSKVSRQRGKNWSGWQGNRMESIYIYLNIWMCE